MCCDFNIKEFTKQLQNSCTKIQIKKVEKNNTITTYIKNRNQIYILASGKADLIKYDVNGNKTIIETLNENDIFGEVFFPITSNNELFVVAKENCEVISFTFDDIIKKCSRTCKFHEMLKTSLLNLIINKIVTQNIRIELLTKRSIREKLKSYFSSLSNNFIIITFSIHILYTDLAEYLSIDRSAMMRELKALQDDNIILRKGNKITLKSKKS